MKAEKREGFLSRRAAGNLDRIYANAAALNVAERNPIIFIPGILGSRLISTKGNRSVWGDFGRFYADPNRPENRNLVALEMAEGVPLHKLRSPSEADGTVREAKPRRIPISVGVYRDIVRMIGVGGQVASTGYDPTEGNHFASFEFGYDWRRSLDETAAKLDKFIRLATYFVQARRQNNDPVKFDIVAHSMGGLVLRYFLRYGAQRLPTDGNLPRLTWAGAQKVSKAVVIGTPNAGSIVGIERLNTGLPAKRLVHPGYDKVLIGTMPAIYQLLPRSRHRPFRHANGTSARDILDLDFWLELGWGLADNGIDDLLAIQLDGVDTPAKRRNVVLDHMTKCLNAARSLHAALDMPAQRPPGLPLHAVVGDAQPTMREVTAAPGDRNLTVLQYDAGDATVLRSSVLLDERTGGTWRPGLRSPIRWSSIAFSNANHMALTRDRVAMNNVLFKILDAPPD